MFEGREEVEREVAAFLGSWLDDAVGKYPDGFAVRTFAVVLEVEEPPDEEGGYPYSEIGYTCSDTRPWVQAGLFRRAMLWAERDIHQPDVETESD